MSIALREGKDLRGPLGQLPEGRPTAAVAEQHEAPIVAPVDQQDRRLDAGQVRAPKGLCRDAHLHVGDAVDQV
jgi:hypothetical protein